jgi:hypothetical protein
MAPPVRFPYTPAGTTEASLMIHPNEAGRKPNGN